MAQTTLIAANSLGASTAVSAASTTTFGVLANNTLLMAMTTEVQCQIKFPVGGTLANYSVFAFTNARATNTTSNIRKNTANGNGSAVCTASTTGWFSDATHTDSLSTSDLLCYSVVTGTGSGNFLLGAASVGFTSSGTVMAPFGCCTPANDGFFVRNVRANLYIGMGGNGAVPSTTESNFSTKLGAAGTVHNFFSYVQQNSNNATTTYTARKNSGAGNNTLSVGSSATGFFEDTTHTDSYAAGDTIDTNWNCTAAASGTQQATVVGCWMDVSGTSQNMFPVDEGSKSGTTTVQNFTPVTGTNGYTTTEATPQISIPFACNWSNIEVNANSTQATTWRSRINGVNGAQSFVVNATGYFSDSTHTDTLSTNDKICLGATPNSATVPNLILDSSSIFSPAAAFIPPGQAKKGNPKPGNGKGPQQGQGPGSNPNPQPSPGPVVQSWQGTPLRQASDPTVRQRPRFGIRRVIASTASPPLETATGGLFCGCGLK